MKSFNLIPVLLGLFVAIQPALAVEPASTRGVIDIKDPTRPADALVLVGPDGHQLVPEDGKPGKWVFADGILTASPEWDSVITRDSYQDFRMHAEFNVNVVENAKDPEANGNSGIYIQQRYEIQILNSFGVPEADYKPSYCGSIYRQKKPDRLVCKKPGEWQSYDIAFRAARFDGDRKTENARITVYQNGELIHDDYSITAKTGVGQKEGPEPRPIKLQGHHNPVRFRNVWIQKLSLGGKAEQASAEALPRVLLIGDSICGGYQKTVKQQLAGKVDVAAIPDNAEYTGTGLKKLDKWLGAGKWDAIHFNWGLWDMYGWEYAKEDRSPAMYEKRLEELVQRLEKTGAKLIWATTTPACPEPEVTMLNRFKTELRISPETERQYQDAAKRVMNKHDIRINDLHALMAPELARHATGPDNVHFTGAGYGMLGKQVATSILAALADPPPQANKGGKKPATTPPVRSEALPAKTVTPGPQPEKPNIILIFIDDLGYGDVSPFGNQKLKTPHLDRMAAEGMKFTSFYATPVCSMSRACLMTGSYNRRVSLPGVLFPNSKIGLHPDETTLAEVVRPQGYATTCIGKWHLGHREPFLPTKQGFDSYFGIPYSNDMTLDPVNAVFAKNCVFRDGMNEAKARERTINDTVPLMRGTEVVEYPADQNTLTMRYTEETVKFIRTNQKKPFFIYLPHTMVHLPLAASAAFRGKSAGGLLGDAVEEIDWSVGQIMQTLRELELDSKTLVIFTSDNGAASGSSAPWRGKKGSIFEGGVREPCIMRWPGRIPAGTTCNRIAGNIDMLPTIAKITAATLPKDRVLDGRDITSLMFQADAPPVRDTHLHFNAWDDKLGAIRQGDWKLFLTSPQRKARPKNGASPKAGDTARTEVGEGALFNLAKDPGETTDVSASQPEMVARLRAEAQRLEQEILQHRRPSGNVPENAR